MKKENLFKWKHYQPDMILLTVRWYLRYNLSFRELVEMMEERGLSIAHTVLVQKLQDNCNKSTNLGHTDTTNLKKVCDWYGKGKCIQMEALST